MNQAKGIFVTLILGLGCSAPPPPEPLEPDLFVQIYSEAIIQSMNPTEEDSLSHLNHALRKHQISRVIFDENVEYYRNNPELWHDIFAKITAELEHRKAN